MSDVLLYLVLHEVYSLFAATSEMYFKFPVNTSAKGIGWGISKHFGLAINAINEMLIGYIGMLMSINDDDEAKYWGLCLILSDARRSHINVSLLAG